MHFIDTVKLPHFLWVQVYSQYQLFIYLWLFWLMWLFWQVLFQNNHFINMLRSFKLKMKAKLHILNIAKEPNDQVNKKNLKS